jgi:hypothetical protein
VLRLATALAVVAAVTACTGDKSGTSGNSASSIAAVDAAAGAITSEGLLQHIADLSADSMEGRGPARRVNRRPSRIWNRNSSRWGSSPEIRTAVISRTWT